MKEAPYNVLKIAQEEVDLCNTAIAAVTECMKTSRLITHERHTSVHYERALSALEFKKLGDEAYLWRVKCLGY
mgnify:CR=1 FL=1